MTARLPLLEECEFRTETTDNGMFVGRVQQFTALRTRRHASSIDALDDIITMARDKLARLADAMDDRKPARQRS